VEFVSNFSYLFTLHGTGQVLGGTINQKSIPFGCLLHLLAHGCQGPVLFFLGRLISFYHGSLRTRRLWIRSHYNKRIWSRRKGVKSYKTWCRENLRGLSGGLPGLWSCLSTVEFLEFSDYQHLY